VFELLSAPIRKYVRDKGWDELRSIQKAAIEHIIKSNKNIILASKTASGKTEAAFLPILSIANFITSGVKVLYISPLIALINDQFFRVEQLCAYLDVPVTKWHGEAKRSLKDELLRKPEGVVLITPESLEAMFTNKPENVRHLFGALEFIVIDEIHSFIGTDRGVQLQSILWRLSAYHGANCRIIGLSATIGILAEAKKFTGNPGNTVVLLDKSAKDMEAQFKYFESEGAELPLDLLKDLYLNTKDKKVLIFPNSRGRAEEIAVKLKKLSDRVNGHPYYFSHHSSIDKELRQHIEHFAKNNQRFPFSIACTSTLELGIDIGTVETVVQIDAAHSIASLIQRVGRSGRKDGTVSSLLFYATDNWSLLQSLACMELYKAGFIEPIMLQEKPFDIMVHQILSIVKQHAGLNTTKLLEKIAENSAFQTIHKTELNEITQHLTTTGILELIGEELIIGIDGERIVNNKDFYSVFKTDPSFKVLHHDKTIGELPLISLLREDDNILLAARIWKIIEIDYKAKKIFVIPAKDGKKPTFFGTGGEIHFQVRKKMLEIIKGSLSYQELDQKATETLRQLRSEFSNHLINDLQYDRPLQEKHSNVILYTFQGTKVNRSLDFLFKQLKIDAGYNEHKSSFTLKMNDPNFNTVLKHAYEKLKSIDSILENSVNENSALIEFSKWGNLLPLKYKCNILKSKHFDFDETKLFLENVQLIHHTK